MPYSIQRSEHAVPQDVSDQEEAGEEDEAEPPHSSLYPDDTIRYNAKRRHWRRTKLGL
ncbi:60S ribosomal protein L39 [Asimina triloba]